MPSLFESRSPGLLSLLCGASLLLQPGLAAAASFDCAKPGLDAVAKTICSTPALSQLDTELGEAYRALLYFRGKAAQARQRKWIRQRAHCGADAGCLTRWTERRLAELRAEAAVVQQQADILGRLSAAWAKD